MSQPPPLDYRNPPVPGPREPFARQFLIGLGCGSLVSLILWCGGWDALMRTEKRFATVGVLTLAAVPLIKLVFGIGMIVRRTYKGAGAGLITSIAVGALIFFGACVGHIGK